MLCWVTSVVFSLVQSTYNSNNTYLKVRDSQNINNVKFSHDLSIPHKKQKKNPTQNLLQYKITASRYLPTLKFEYETALMILMKTS